MAGQDHLQRHRAVEPLLPRLVDHAHPAAADLADQLIRAEIAGHRGEGGLAVGLHGLRPRRRRQLIERLQAIERRAQFRVLPQDRTPIRLLARLKPGKIIIEQIQVFFVVRFVGHFCMSVRK